MDNLPRFRNDLQISEQESGGAKIFVIKDPISEKFFRFREMEYFLARCFDGQTDNETVAQKFQNKFGVSIGIQKIEQFCEQLQRTGLFESKDSQRLIIYKKPKRSLFGRLIFIKIRAFNPYSLVEKTYGLAKPFYTKIAMKIYLTLALFAGALTLFNIEGLTNQAKTFFTPGIIPLVWITIFVVTIIHELSHTYSCRLHGGKVTDMGLLLIYLQPCFYSNVSDAYLFPDRQKRIAVTMAGIISQIVIWAIATIIWRLTDTDNFINWTAFIIIALSFIAVIFNLNPLLKLDGYYFLVDYWDIPNLRQKAFLYLRQKLIGLTSQEEGIAATSRERKIFRYYGIASLIYSAALIGYIVYRIGIFTDRQFGGIGVAFLVIVILYFILDAMSKGKIFRVIYDQRGEILKPSKMIIYAGIFILILIVMFIIHYPMRVTNECTVLPLEQIYLRASTTPGLIELFVERADEERSLKQFKLTNQDYSIMSLLPVYKVGDKVKKGDLIANIKSNIYVPDSLDRLGNLERAKSQLDLLEKGPQLEQVTQTEDIIKQTKVKLEKSAFDLTRAESLFTRGSISADELESKRMADQLLHAELDFYNNQLILLKRGARPEELEIAKTQVNQLSGKLKHLQTQMEQTVIESPIDGMVTMLNNGNIVFAIARTDSVKARIFVPEKEISVVKMGNPVKMKVRSFPALTYSGIVTKIEPLVGDEADKHRVIIVTARIDNSDGTLKPGMTGKAKINCGSWPIYRLILWRVVRYIRVEFWSWW